MVKVILFNLFDKQHVLGPNDEPVDVAPAGHEFIVGTQSGVILVFSSGDDCVLVHRFRTVFPELYTVRYLPASDCVVTVEGGSEFNDANVVRLYHDWRSLSNSPSGSAAGSQYNSGGMNRSKTHALDISALSVSTGRAFLLPTQDSVTCLDVCQASNRIAVATGTTVSVWELNQTERGGPPLALLHAQAPFVVDRLSLAPSYLAVADDYNVKVFRYATARDGTEDEAAGRPLSAASATHNQRRPFAGRGGGDSASSSAAAADPRRFLGAASVGGGSGGGGGLWGDGSAHVPHQGEEAAAAFDLLGPVLSLDDVGISYGDAFTRVDFEAASAGDTLSLPSVSQRKPPTRPTTPTDGEVAAEAVGGGGWVAVGGGSGAVARAGPGGPPLHHVGEVPAYSAVRPGSPGITILEFVELVHRRMEADQRINTVAFVPDETEFCDVAFDGSSDGPEAEAGASAMLLPGGGGVGANGPAVSPPGEAGAGQHQRQRRMRFLLSSSKLGVLYDLNAGVVLTEYPYTNRARFAAVDSRFLYTVNATNLETWTLRSYDRGHYTAYPEPCIFGMDSFVGMRHVVVGRDTVILLAKIYSDDEFGPQAKKTTEDIDEDARYGLVGRPPRRDPASEASSPFATLASLDSAGSGRAAEAVNWSLNVLHPTSMSTVYDSVLERAEMYGETSEPVFFQLVLEGYLMLKSNLAELTGAADRVAAGGGGGGGGGGGSSAAGTEVGSASDVGTSHHSSVVAGGADDIAATTARHLEIDNCRHLIRESARLLGEYQLLHGSAPRCAAYFYAQSALPLSAVFGVFQRARSDPEIIPTAEGRARVDVATRAFLDAMLFSEGELGRADLTPELADSVVDFYHRVAPTALPGVILYSALNQYSQEHAAACLRDTAAALQHERAESLVGSGLSGLAAAEGRDEAGAPVHDSDLALFVVALLDLDTGKTDDAATALQTISPSALVSLCVASPGLLDMTPPSELPADRAPGLVDVLRTSLPWTLLDVLVALALEVGSLPVPAAVATLGDHSRADEVGGTGEEPLLECFLEEYIARHVAARARARQIAGRVAANGDGAAHRGESDDGGQSSFASVVEESDETFEEMVRRLVELYVKRVAAEYAPFAPAKNRMEALSQKALGASPSGPPPGGSGGGPSSRGASPPASSDLGATGRAVTPQRGLGGGQEGRPRTPRAFWLSRHEAPVNRRYTWLERLPPFSAKVERQRGIGAAHRGAAASATARMPSRARTQEFYLFKLQALICAPEVISDYDHVLTSVTSAAAAYPGRVSLVLLCLPQLDRLDEAFDVLVETHPEVLFPYAQSFCRSLADWERLLGGLRDSLAVAGPDSPHCAAYAATLEHLSVALSPEAFLALLPSGGPLGYYLPYVERSIQHAASQTTHTMILEGTRLAGGASSGDYA